MKASTGGNRDDTKAHPKETVKKSRVKTKHQPTDAPDKTVTKTDEKTHHTTTDPKGEHDVFSTAVMDNSIQIPVKNSKKSKKPPKNEVNNKENVVNPAKSNNSTTKECHNDQPTRKKKSSQSNPAEADTKSTTDSTVRTTTTTTTTTKPKKLTFQEQVMVHMLNALKPFTLKSLSEEMKTSESSINFVLLSLIDKGLVVQKDFTSSKGRVKTLYWANHNAKAKEVKVSCTTTADATALATKEERDKVHRHMLELRNEIMTIQNQYQQVLQTPSNDDLTTLLTQQEIELQTLYRTRDEVHERIRNDDNNAVVVTNTALSKQFGKGTKRSYQLPKDKCPIRLKQRINQFRDVWKTRKIKCMDFIDQLADGLEKKTKDVMVLCDIDTDEMNQVVLPNKYLIP
jgi:predicted transcriptional regulator